MKFIVYTHTSSFYGAPKSIFDITNELVKLGHDVIYILPEKGPFYDRLVENQYSVKILPNPEWLYAPRKKKYSKYFFLKHKIKLLFNFCFQLPKAIEYNKQFLKTVNPDFIIVNTTAAPVGLIASHRLGFKSILWIRESILNKKGVYVPCLAPKWLVKNIFNLAKIKIGPSKFIKEYYENSFNLKNIHVIPDGVKTNDVEIKFAKLNKPVTFGLIGSISERKGQIEFVTEMFELNENYRVTIYGEGPKEQLDILEKFKNKYPDRINLMPFEGNLQKIYSSFDVYVNLGKDESFGRTTIEAMRFGKLIFGRNSGATKEIIDHGNNGYLFTEIKEIFEKLKNLKDQDVEVILKNSKKYSEIFQPESIIQKFIPMIDLY